MFPLVMALLLAAPPAPAPKASSTPDWSLPAGAALATPDAIVVWAPDFRSVLGIDARGRRLWRVATGDQGGFRDLQPIGDNVLAYAGQEAILIAPKTGRVLGRRANVTLEAPGVPGCHIDVHQGACALRCPCSFLPIRCEDLAAIAPRATMPYIEEFDLEGNRTSTCLGAAGELLARGGRVVVASVAGSTDPKAMSVATDLVGYATTAATPAKELWRVAKLGGLAASAAVPDLSGALADGDTCWIGSRSGELRVFDCQRATLRWSRRLAVPAGTEPQIESDGTGIVVRDGDHVRRLAADGSVQWQVSVPKNELFVLSGPAAPRDRRFAKLVGARVLDPATGAERGALRFSPGTTRWPLPWPIAPFGHVALGDEDYAVLLADRTQPIEGKSSAFIEELVPGQTVVAVRTRKQLTIRGLHDSFVTTIDGDLIVAVEGLAGPGKVIVLKQGTGPWDPKEPKTFGELRRYTFR